MNILAIDSSAVTATAAILSGDTVVAEASVTTALTHSQTLLPMIKNVLSSAGLSPQVTAMATQRVRLPMPGRAESLNAAIAASIMMYDFVRVWGQP